MGFFQFNELEKPAAAPSLKGFSIELLHKKQCAVCPLNHERDLRHPHMEPTGSAKPIVYMLGEAPGKEEDRRGIQFVGASGQLLRMRVPDDWLGVLRWNNCVRTRPPGNRDPSMVELECCRPSIIADIEATKPQAIFGFGGVPLDWALGEGGITKWAGRRIPVKVGKHVCWFFPHMHPVYILRSRKFTPRDPKAYGSDLEFTFAVHLRNAFDSIDDLPKPRVYTKEELISDVSYVTGEGGWKDVDRVLEYLHSCYDEKHVGFDYETNGLRPYAKGAKICTVGLARKQDAFAFPLHHSQSKWEPSQLKEVQKELRRFLYEARCRKISHSLAFELEWTAYFYGRDAVLDGQWEDTLAEAFILDERPWSNSLDFLFLQYFGLRIKGISNVNRKAIDKEPLCQVLKYNAIDAKAHRMLHFAQTAELKYEGLLEVYRHQLRRVVTMALTTLKGVPIDQKVAGKFFDGHKHDLDAIAADIRDLPIVKRFKQVFGHELQPSNNDDVLHCLQRLAGLNNLSATNEKELGAFKGKHPIIKLIFEWRSVAKTISTYILPVIPPSPHLYPDGLLHPVMETCKVRTNRTSSGEPNIQNWPMHKEGKIVRRQVKPGGEYIVVKVDYSGMQARNVAMESLDAQLVKYYWEGYDIHSDWRGRIMRLVPDWISKKDRADKDRMKHWRQEAKNKFVFPAFFGAQARTLAGGLGIPEDKAERMREEFYELFPDVLAWHKQKRKEYDRLGYISGLSGFRRHCPIKQTQLINSPIQSDEALIVCNAQERLSRRYDDELRKYDERVQANLMVHDDLTFIWLKRDLDKLAEIVVKEMLYHEFEWTKVVPLGVEVSFGPDWFTMTKYGEFENTRDFRIKEIKK